MPGVSVKLKAISAKVWKFIVEIENACMNDGADQPDQAADQAQQQRLDQERHQDARRARSRARAACRSRRCATATLAYIVIMAPMIAPMEKITERVSRGRR